MSTNMSVTPTGEERKVQMLGGAAIDGAPIAYIVVLAAVVTALAFIPLGVLLASGGSFPMSQAIYGLVGWILGPIAGAIANGIGAVIGIFLAPQTGSIPVATVWWAVITGLAAGAMVLGNERSKWWIPLTVLFVIELAIYAGTAIVRNGINPWPVFTCTFIDWSGILLFALPTRTLFARWINGKNLVFVALGLFFATWMLSGVGHVSRYAIAYPILNWAEQLFATLTFVSPLENLTRSIAGAVIGTGVIAGLRAIGIVKSKWGIY